MHETIKKERALLVMVEVEREKWSSAELAEEFKSLVSSTGLEVAHLELIKRREISPALYIGKGKLEELLVIVQEEDVNVVIFNNNLSFAQQRNLEDVLGVKTIDRTQLILDIFAAHARTQEGILQVELAQAEYLLPRLKGKGVVLSRLGGGIGTRGPGEKKLEVDRRRITDRITRLKKDLIMIKQHREIMRKRRRKEQTAVCSLVGYTNAGKSTLFNVLTESSERVSADLFTTLDTVTRQFTLRHSLKVILSDTVGFIYKLPLNLVEAFKATLEELCYADVLLHIIDVSNKEILRLRESVDSILKELNVCEKPLILVFNKIDLLLEREVLVLEKDFPDAVFVSALEKINIERLKEKIYQVLFSGRVQVILRFPFNLMSVIKYIHDNCEVLKTVYQQEEVVYWVKIEKPRLSYLREKGVVVKDVSE